MEKRAKHFLRALVALLALAAGVVTSVFALNSMETFPMIAGAVNLATVFGFVVLFLRKDIKED